MKIKLIYALIGFLQFIFTGCLEKKIEIDIHKTVTEDKSFLKSLESNTRSVKVFKSFENKVQLSATYIGNDFKKALDRRVKDLYQEENTIFTNSDSKVGFFISVFSPLKGISNIADTTLWSIYVVDDNVKKYPIKITQIYNKQRWQSFFPYINFWTQEYFVLFDYDDLSDESIELLEKRQLNLVLSNSDAKIKLSWP